MRTVFVTLCAVTSAIGCGGDDAGSVAIDSGIDGAISIDAAIDAPPAVFTLTSTTIGEGAAFPLVHTCDGANLSPPLMWIQAPAGTQSFAIVFTDIYNTTSPFIHSVIYDIPATTASLPANVEKTYAPANAAGAHQTLAYNNTTRGYLGPCPPPADPAHTYELALYALGVATLPTATMTTSRAAAATLITANMLAVAKLRATADR